MSKDHIWYISYEILQKHKQVLISGKMQHKLYIRTCKMEMCNITLKISQEQDMNNVAA